MYLYQGSIKVPSVMSILRSSSTAAICSLTSAVVDRGPVAEHFPTPVAGPSAYVCMYVCI